MTAAAAVERFRRARRDPELAVLEGFHALKHAFRFGAEVLEIATTDAARLQEVARALAPDVEARFGGLEAWPRDVFDRLSPAPPRESVIALARRRPAVAAQVLEAGGSAPIVFLENPRNPGNIGAVVRVAAAAGAAGVLTTGEHDPWSPAALRGAAGLNYALPVVRIAALPASDRALVVLDPAGEALAPGILPARAILAFGSERHGVSVELRSRADLRVAISMRPGVSSLSLATAVAVALYT